VLTCVSISCAYERGVELLRPFPHAVSAIAAKTVTVDYFDQLVSEKATD